MTIYCVEWDIKPHCFSLSLSSLCMNILLKHVRLLLTVVACRSSLSASSEIGFSWITPAILNRPRRNFTQGWALRWDAHLESLGALGHKRQKMAQKKMNFFVRKTPPKCHLSAVDLREIWIQSSSSLLFLSYSGSKAHRKVNRCGHQSFRKRNANFTLKGSFTPKPDFWAVF